MPRILLLVTDLEIGGTPTVVRELAVRLHALAGAGDDVKVACLGGFGPVARQIAAHGVEVEALEARSARDVRVIGRLSRLMTRGRIDTVLSFLVHANAAAAAVRAFNRTVRYFQSIQTTQPDPAWHWFAQRMASVAARKIVVPSESVADVAGSWAGVSRKKIVVISNAVEPEQFAHLVGKPRRPSAIGFIGRLDPVKRVQDLLAGLPRLIPIVEGVTVDIYGDGPQRAALESQIDTLAIRGQVTMHGAVEDVRAALSEMGVLVLPSSAEGFGLVLIEAMAAGVPVVATDVPGIRDVVKHEVNGLLVPVGAPASLALAIDRIISDEELRARLVKGGLAVVSEKFAWNDVIKQYARLLRLN